MNLWLVRWTKTSSDTIFSPKHGLRTWKKLCKTKNDSYGVSRGETVQLSEHTNLTVNFFHMHYRQSTIWNTAYCKLVQLMVVTRTASSTYEWLLIYGRASMFGISTFCDCPFLYDCFDISSPVPMNEHEITWLWSQLIPISSYCTYHPQLSTPLSLCEVDCSQASWNEALLSSFNVYGMPKWKWDW
jgi:hypothetical protein